MKTADKQASVGLLGHIESQSALTTQAEKYISNKSAPLWVYLFIYSNMVKSVWVESAALVAGEQSLLIKLKMFCFACIFEKAFCILAVIRFS